MLKLLYQNFDKIENQRRSRANSFSDKKVKKRLIERITKDFHIILFT